jgi:Tfp pilus assembly protein PilF
MTRIRWILAMLASLTLTAEASAQFFPLVIGVPIIQQSGIDFHFGGGHLRINGFIPLGNPYTAVVPLTPTPFGFRQVGPAFIPYPYAYPVYGSIDRRLTLQIINPPALSSRLGLKPTYDLSGIDLDVEPASKIWGEKPAVAKGGKGAPAKKGEFVKAAPKDQKNVEIAKAAAPEDKKVQVPANEAKAPAVRPPPKVEPVPDGQRLNDQGVAAFRNGEYGLAMLRFGQAVDAEKPPPRALFLRGQACIAVGKYREAAEIIQQGLQLQPNWPASGFNPRLELYDKQEDEWTAQRKRLEQTQSKNPKNADYLFLLGYVAWFDGQRDAAIDYFQQGRALAAEPRWADLFLKAAKGN